jgi:hypothetical protein
MRVSGIDRRGFLALLGATGAIALSGRALTAWSAAEPNHSLVWRLDSHWGYPAGKQGRTHCQCNACVQHARNKVFASQADAEDGRAHAHCGCRPRAVQIDATKFSSLFPDGGGSVDLRNGDTASAYQAALVSSRAS